MAREMTLKELKDYLRTTLDEQTYLTAVRPIVAFHKDVEGLQVETSTGSVKIENLRYAVPDKPGTITNWERLRDLKLKGGTNEIRVYADVTFTKKVGRKTTTEKKRYLIARIPFPTRMGTFIVKGKEFIVTNMVRRAPGTYVVMTARGPEVQFNLKRGRNFQIVNDDGILLVEIGTRHFHAYNLAKALGISDATLRKWWGDEVFEANKEAAEGSLDSDIRGIVQALNYGKDLGDTEKNKEFIREYFRGTIEMDPKINRETIGVGAGNLTNEVFLKATAKMINVMNGRDKPIHHNDMRYRTFHAPHDLLIERWQLMFPDIKRTIAYRIRRAKDVKHAVPTGFFSKPFTTFFSGTRLALYPDMNNPVEILANRQKITPLGEGGYTDMRAIPLDVRFFHGSGLGIIDPVYTPEGAKTGLSLHVVSNVTINKGKAFLKLRDPKRGIVYVPHSSLHDKIVALPGQEGKKKVWAIDYSKPNPEPELVDAKKVDYWMVNWGNLLSLTTLLLPNINRTSIPRLAMATKHTEQALPLKDPEPPLIRGVGLESTELKRQVDELLGRRSPVDGTVKRVQVGPKGGKIVIQGDDGKTYTIGIPVRYPLNNQAALTATRVLVSMGDRVKRGQPLFETNFHKGDDLAIGVNLRVGYLTTDLETFKDGVVISESAAKKLAAHRVVTIDIPKDLELSLDKARSIAPSLVSPEKISKLDRRGIVKPGMTLRPGDVVFFGVRKVDLTPEDIILGRISKALKNPYRPVVITWDRLASSRVIAVEDAGDRFVVMVESVEPAKPGDKIAGRYGNKGVITRVLPDDLMPKDESGRPLEVIISPLAIPTRTNPSQLVETALGQWAEKTGKPMVIDPFDQKAVDILEDLIKKGKIKPTQKVKDPRTGKEVKALVGKQYFYRLMHTSDFGLSGRGYGEEGYDVNLQPVTGTRGGAKKLGWLMQAALLAHGVGDFLEEKRFYTSTRHPAFWAALINGHPIPEPKPTFATQKLFSLLMGAHIKPIQSTKSVQLTLLTDDDIKEIARKVPKPTAMLFGASLKPERGGLFDPAIFGGMSGDQYGYIELPESIPNPTAREGIMSVLGLNQTEYRKVIEGKLFWDPESRRFTTKNTGIKGFDAIRDALNSLDVDQEIRQTSEWLMAAQKKGATNTTDFRKQARKLKYLKSLKTWLEQNPGKKPSDLYMNRYLLVIPPKFRPVYPTDSGDLIVSEINHPYRDAAMAMDAYKKLKEIPVKEEERDRARAKMYEAVEALFGLGTPIGPVPARGALDQIQGPVNKAGFYQAHVIKVPQDVSGRGVLGVDPSLKLDEIGIPEPLAWKIFKPLILKKLRSMGLSLSDAMKHYNERTPEAKRALQEVEKEALVVANRAPTLHKYNMLAFRPKIYYVNSEGSDVIKEQQIRFTPAVFEGYNADLDGDQISVFVPVTPKAMRDAERMLPSKNAVQYGKSRFLMFPEEEAMATLYKLSVPGEKPKNPKRFKSYEELERASQTLAVGGNEIVLLKGKETWYGREFLKRVFKGKWDGKTPLNKRLVHRIMYELYREDPKAATRAVNDIMDVIRRHMYDTTFTFPLEELLELRKKKQQIKDPKDLLKKAPPTIREMLQSQVRGKPYQYFALGVRVNEKNPFSRSYFEGLSPDEFLREVNIGRQGLVGRALETAKPGEMMKSSLGGLLSVRILGHDGPDPGIEMPINDPDIIDRYIARDVKVNGKLVFKKDTLVDESVVRKARELGLKTLPVRSPLSSRGGIWAKSFGLLDDGRLPTPEEHIGVITAHVMNEPLTQMILNKFHTHVEHSPADDLLQFFRLPQSRDNWALVAPKNGTVREIRQIRKRRYIILEDGTRLPAPKGKRILVRPGDRVKKGQKLTTGEIDPRDIAEMHGIEAARHYLTQKIQESYTQAGIPLRRRYIETFVRGMTSYVKVEDPGDSPLMPGDVIHELEYDALAKRLAAEGKRPPVVKPVIVGVNMAPFMSTDFLTRMVVGKIKPTLTEGALLGWRSSIKSLSPIPQMVLGPVNLADIDPAEALTL